MNVIDIDSRRQAKLAREKTEIPDTVDFDALTDEISNDIARDVLSYLEELDYIAENNLESVNDILMIIESIKAYMHRTMDQPHRLHEVTDQVFDVANLGDDDKIQFLDVFWS